MDQNTINLIQQELLNDPLSLGYANVSNSYDLAMLLLKPISQSPKQYENAPIPKGQLANVILEFQIWEAIETAALDKNSSAHIPAFIGLRLIQYGDELVDTSNSTFQAMRDALVQAQLMTQEQADQLTALGQKETLQSRLYQLGIGDPQLETVVAFVNAARQ